MPITQRSNRRVGTALLAVFAATSLLPTSTASADADRQDRIDLGTLVLEHAADAAGTGADAPARPGLVAGVAAELDAAGTSSPSSARADADDTVRAAAACANTIESDPRDAPHLDGNAYLLSYDCEDGAFVAAVTTYDHWVRDELDGYLVSLDTDHNAASGCQGADYAVVGYWDAQLGLTGRVLRTPTCDDAGWSDRGAVYIERAGATDFLAIVFDAAQIGSPGTVRWRQVLSGIGNPGADLMPDQGSKITQVPGSAPAPSQPAVQTVFGYGTPFHGSTAGARLNAPLVGMAPTADGGGYWLLGGDGGIFSYGNAAFHGSTGGMRLNKPVVGMTAPRSGAGYWLVASDGGIFAFDVPFHGSAGALRLNEPVVGMAATTSGNGYWLVASDGGIFSYGDAGFSGSTGAMVLNQPIVGMAADPDGVGYWFVAADGGVFAFDAAFHGSATGHVAPGDRVVSMAANPRGGYWVTSAKGAVYAFGGAAAHGSATTTGRSFVGVAAHPTNGGYWLLAAQ